MNDTIGKLKQLGFTNSHELKKFGVVLPIGVIYTDNNYVIIICSVKGFIIIQALETTKAIGFSKFPKAKPLISNLRPEEILYNGKYLFIRAFSSSYQRFVLIYNIE